LIKIRFILNLPLFLSQEGKKKIVINIICSNLDTEAVEKKVKVSFLPYLKKIIV